MKSKKLLDKVNYPCDIKNFSNSDLNILSSEIRDLIISTVSNTGGHLASNLGVVELTIALHKCFNTPEDQIVWDVGHQCYTHKILTGRKDRFPSIRTKDGLSGFPRPSESEYDAFIGGHSSTSISAACGLAVANRLKGKENYTIAVIGDGALTGGLAYEGLNNAGRLKNSGLIIILNDNNMSISRNVGAMSRYLAKIRSKKSYFRLKDNVVSVLDYTPIIGKPIKTAMTKTKAALKSAIYHSTWFEDMGFSYYGPVDGHDISALCAVFEDCKKSINPVLIHIDTQKGKGYSPAEINPNKFHGVSKFDVITGETSAKKSDFSEAFGSFLFNIAAQNKKVCAITAAMKTGTGLYDFANMYHDRFFDVGIAEEHAVTFACGLARNGMIPVFAVYSSFLQRSYDQLIHDAAIQKCHIVLAIDRAGLVGEDGSTHQGVFDACFMNSIPSAVMYSPATYKELEIALDKAINQETSLVGVRYPRGREVTIPDYIKDSEKDYCFVKGSQKILIITYGRIIKNVIDCCDSFNEKPSLLKLNKIKPINADCFHLSQEYDHVVFFEEGIKSGGIGETFGYNLVTKGFKGQYHHIAINDEFTRHCSVDEAMKHHKLDAASMREYITHII